ncbi:MAG: twin transmembrane helix small protein [Gammaproteobacteria bacterium]|nr:MAG: twin transmembrane helix small protein [Gammaproteobacteria bacterium]
MIIKSLIILMLLAIIASLGYSLVFLVKDDHGSKRMVKALTWRISLSVALFLLLILAWSQGLIHPHGLGG